MRWARCAVAMLASSALAVSAVAAAAPPGRTLHVKGAVLEIAADGGLVAINRQVAICGGISVWRPSTGATLRVPVSALCAGGASSPYLVALGGNRLVWKEAEAANTYSDDEVLTALAGGAKATTLAATTSYHGESAHGPQYAGFAGDGGLLVYGVWTLGARGEEGAGRLLRVDGARSVLLRRTSGRILGASVDGGTIALVQPGKVTLLARDGKVLRELVPGGAEIDAAALQGGILAVQQGRTLGVYRASTGRLERSIALPAGAQLADLAGGIAAVVEGDAVVLVRLSDGRRAVAARPPGTNVLAQLEPAGLSYAYSSHDNADGYVVFVPWPELQRLLRK